MTSPGHVASPLPPPSACDQPDEEAPLEVDSDSSSDGEGSYAQARQASSATAPAVMTRKATVVAMPSVKAWTHGCPLYRYNTSLVVGSWLDVDLRHPNHRFRCFRVMCNAFLCVHLYSAYTFDASNG